MLKKFFSYMFVREEKTPLSKVALGKVKDKISAESITCKRCHFLSVPIYDSSNKYLCVNCKNQFANTKHNIRDWLISYLQSDTKRYYDEAVVEIRRKQRR